VVLDEQWVSFFARARCQSKRGLKSLAYKTLSGGEVGVCPSLVFMCAALHFSNNPARTKLGDRQKAKVVVLSSWYFRTDPRKSH